jgi:hypothetical protein
LDFFVAWFKFKLSSPDIAVEYPPLPAIIHHPFPAASHHLLDRSSSVPPSTSS